MRVDGRGNDALRPIQITPGAMEYADGSALVAFGKTKVLCAATIQESVPAWLKGRGSGWVTGEYAMLPRAGVERSSRRKASTGCRAM